jgi:hypothetical protein
MRPLFMSKKGTSAVFAVMLLTILTVAAGIMFYNYVTSCVDSMKTNLATQLSLLLLESANINSTCITAYVRNAGSMEVSITDAYVNNQPATLSQTVYVPPASLETAHVLGAYMQGMTYTVKLTSVLGTLLTFKVTF